MIAKHACGHEVEVSAQFAPYIRRAFCDECRELALKLQREQNKRFAEVREEATNDKTDKD